MTDYIKDLKFLLLLCALTVVAPALNAENVLSADSTVTLNTVEVVATRKPLATVQNISGVELQSLS